jgi:hypothetical protein
VNTVAEIMGSRVMFVHCRLLRFLVAGFNFHARDNGVTSLVKRTRDLQRRLTSSAKAK